ncbi:MAG: NTP transferase domain-containing protein [Ilumatobacteraceae bacterium]
MNQTPPSVARATSTPLAVLLAAGRGSRFSGPTHKLLAEFRGRPVLAWAIDAVVQADLPLCIVTGLDPQVEVLADTLVRNLALTATREDSIRVVRNPLAHTGMASSLAAAVALANDLGATSIVVGLGDQPLVPSEAWRAVADAEPLDRIAIAEYRAAGADDTAPQRANPVRLPRAVWPELPTSGDRGARDLLRNRPGHVIAVACPGNPADIDTLEDLHRWNS